MTNELIAEDVFLIVMAVVTRSELLVDRQRLKGTLLEVAARIGMNAISEPSVSSAVNNPGLEGYLPIDASNITISTYTTQLRLVACVHSCRLFDYRLVIACLRERYEFVDCLQRVVREWDLEKACYD